MGKEGSVSRRLVQRKVNGHRVLGRAGALFGVPVRGVAESSVHGRGGADRAGLSTLDALVTASKRRASTLQAGIFPENVQPACACTSAFAGFASSAGANGSGRCMASRRAADGAAQFDRRRLNYPSLHRLYYCTDP